LVAIFRVTHGADRRRCGSTCGDTSGAIAVNHKCVTASVSSSTTFSKIKMSGNRVSLKQSYIGDVNYAPQYDADRDGDIGAQDGSLIGVCISGSLSSRTAQWFESCFCAESVASHFCANLANEEAGGELLGRQNGNMG
jgi:hypothetical protein